MSLKSQSGYHFKTEIHHLAQHYVSAAGSYLNIIGTLT